MKYLRYLLSKIGFAIQGIGFFLDNRNGRIQLAIAVLVSGFGIHYEITSVEWCVLLLAIALVMGLEMINNSIKLFCDHIRPEKHGTIKKVKDIAKGAVWWATVIAIVVGGLVFYPYVFK
jgi:diacylglycerol kinase (ATP)